MKPKATTRRAVAASVETTPEPAQATKKRGRDRSKAKPDSDQDDVEDLEEKRSRKRGRKSNGVTRKASPSPASSSDRASPIVELLEPSTIKKWGDLPSWERHIETIDTVEKSEEGDLFIYFKLYVFRLSVCPTLDTLEMLLGRVRRQHARKIQKSVPRSSPKRCASRLFYFPDLSNVHILAHKVLRGPPQVETGRGRAGFRLRSSSLGLSPTLRFPLLISRYFLSFICKCTLSFVFMSCAWFPLLFAFRCYLQWRPNEVLISHQPIRHSLSSTSQHRVSCQR